jgi:hypothetical protein
MFKPKIIQCSFFLNSAQVISSNVIYSFNDLNIELVALEKHRPTHYSVVGELGLV